MGRRGSVWFGCIVAASGLFSSVLQGRPPLPSYKEFAEGIRQLPFNRSFQDNPRRLKSGVSADEFGTVLHQYINAQKSHLAGSPWLGVRGSDSATPFLAKAMLPHDAKVIFFGDFHGDAHGLRVMFDQLESKGILSAEEPFQLKDPNTYVVFLGDYTDRGFYGAEVIYAALRLKLANFDRVWLVRGNHEDIQLNVNYGFYDELRAKYTRTEADATFGLIQGFYEQLPVGLFLGTKATAGKVDFLLCAHGGGELGFDHSGFLSDENARFVRVGELLRRTNLALLRRETNAGLQRTVSRSYLQDTHSSSILGFQWTDFNVDPSAVKPIFTEGRGIAFTRALTQEYLNWGDREQFVLRGIFRAHQHDATPTPMMTKLLNLDKSQDPGNLGVAKLWTPVEQGERPGITPGDAQALWDGIVVTFLVAPDSYYGEDLNYNFGTYGVLQLAPAFGDWRLHVHRVTVAGL